MQLEFPSVLLELCPEQGNLIKWSTSKSKQGRFLYTELPLNVLYHFMKFQHNPLNGFGFIPRTRKFNKGK